MLFFFRVAGRLLVSLRSSTPVFFFCFVLETTDNLGGGVESKNRKPIMEQDMHPKMSKVRSHNSFLGSLNV